MDLHTPEQIQHGHRDWYCPVCEGVLRVETLPGDLYLLELVIDGEEDVDPVVVQAHDEEEARAEGFRRILVQFDEVTEYEREMIAAAYRIRHRLQNRASRSSARS